MIFVAETRPNFWFYEMQIFVRHKKVPDLTKMKKKTQNLFVF